ncbi:hypothetical protein LguiB_015431 [Lonicera macranthoides]
MEDQCSPQGWGCYYQEEGIQELKHSLWCASMELETTILYANEELARKDIELAHLKGLLSKTTKERDEAQAKCRSLALIMYDNLLLPHQHQQLLENNQPIGGGDSNTGISSSGCTSHETITAGSPSTEQIPQPLPEVVDKALPENGKFLQAVMEAGPLLQTLLLAGPLPQWQHPPPKLNATEIPPVTIPPPPPTPQLRDQDSSCITTKNTSFTMKRDLVEYSQASDYSPLKKNQKVVHLSLLTSI